MALMLIPVLWDTRLGQASIMYLPPDRYNWTTQQMHPSPLQNGFFRPQQLESLLHRGGSSSYDKLQNQVQELGLNNQYLTSVNQQLKIENNFLVEKNSLLSDRIKDLQGENQRLLSRTAEGINNPTSRRISRQQSSDFQSKQLEQLLEQTRHESAQRTLSNHSRNSSLERTGQLTMQIQKIRERVAELGTENDQLKEMLKQKMEENASLKSGLGQDNRFKRREVRLEEELAFVGDAQGMSKQTSLSSVEMINSSMESLIRQDMVEELRQQNQLLHNQLMENNSKFQSQIQKLNEYIDKLLAKQAQIEPLKVTLSTLFNALTVSFIDFNDEKQLYENKILQLLAEVASDRLKTQAMRKEAERLSKQVSVLQSLVEHRK